MNMADGDPIWTMSTNEQFLSTADFVPDITAKTAGAPRLRTQFPESWIWFGGEDAAGGK